VEIVYEVIGNWRIWICLQSMKLDLKIFGLVMSNEHNSDMDDLWIWCEVRWIWIAFTMSKNQCWDRFWSLINQWIWIAFTMSERQCWDCSWSLENQWIWVAFAMSGGQCWDVSEGYKETMYYKD